MSRHGLEIKILLMEGEIYRTRYVMKPENKTAAPRTNVERIYHDWDSALAAKNVDAAIALYAPHATLESPLIPHLIKSERGIRCGHEEQRAFIEAVFRATPDARHNYRTGYFTDGRPMESRVDSGCECCVATCRSMLTCFYFRLAPRWRNGRRSGLNKLIHRTSPVSEEIHRQRVFKAFLGTAQLTRDLRHPPTILRPQPSREHSRRCKYSLSRSGTKKSPSRSFPQICGNYFQAEFPVNLS
jgi:hypothetical protein